MKTYYHLDNNYLNKPLYYGDISLFQIGRAFLTEDGCADEHLHLDWFELTIATDGRGIIGTGDKEVGISRGDIFISFPADLHSVRSDAERPLKYDFITFSTSNDEYRAALDAIRTRFIEPDSRVFSDDRIKNAVSLLISEISNKASLHHEDLVYSLLKEIIIYIERDFNERKSASPYLNTDSRDILCYQIMSYIDTHVFSLVHLSELEGVMNYNYSYLSNLFKNTTGMTLTDYYTNARMRAAKLLISEGKLKVAEIAELLNYSSIYAFSRAYKRKYGISPTSRSGEN